MANIVQNPFGRMREPRADFEAGRVSVSDAGLVGRALGNVAETVQDIGVLFEREKLDSELTNLETRTLKDVQDFQQQLQEDPDFGSHEQKWDDWLEGRQSQYEREFSPDAWSQFQPRLQEITLNTRSKIRGNARKKQIDMSKAQLKLDLRDVADLYARTDNQEDRQALVGLASDSIASRQNAGFLTAQEAVDHALDFRDRLAITDIRTDMLADPEDVQQRLLAGEYSLSEEDRAVWLARAQTASEAAVAKRVRLNDRADREAENEQKETEKNTAKEALRLEANGQLTLDWILDNEASLSVANFRSLLEGIREPANDDMSIVIALHDRIDDGIDVGQDISNAMFDGQLTRTTADSIRARNDRMFGREKPSTPYKRSTQFLAQAMKPSDMNDNPDASFAYANAVMEFDNWFDQNPNADATTALAEAQKIADSYRIVPASPFSVALPDWMVGSRFKPDFDATEAQIAVDFQTGAIDADELDKRAQRVKELRDIYSARPGGQ